MPISVPCASCRAALAFPDGSAGRTTLCPHCGDKIQRPPARAAAELDDGADAPPSRSPSLLVSVSLFCGCTSLCFASVPALTLLTKPLSALGLVLGAAAWAWGRPRKEPAGRLLPLALAVCLLDLFFAGSWQDWKQAVSRPGRAARERKVVVPAGTQAMEPFARAEPDEWLDVTKGAVEQNGVRVRVTSAALGAARIRAGGKEQRPPGKRLLIGVRLTGEHLVRLTNYESWADPAREAARHEPRLTDDRERAYRRATFGAGAELAGSSGDTFLTPGKPIVDLLAFEAPPLDGIQFLRLELPASAFGGAGTLRFQIPKSSIKLN